MEFHSVTINGDASSALELSSSAPNSSSSSSSSQSTTNNNNSSSSQSSPENNSLSAASTPDLSAPATLQAQQSVNISIITVQAPEASSAFVQQLRPTKAEILKGLKESIPHRMKMQQLQKSEKGYQKEASSHKKTVRRLSKELYLIMSLYALLQGVLFTAVAQSSVFSCEDWWGPAGIVGAVTLGTAKGVIEKLRRMGIEKQEVKKFETRQSSVYDKIELLYFRGAACSIESLDPNHGQVFDEAPDILCIFSLHGLLVLGFLIGFSVLIMASYSQMLCHNCHCRNGS